MTPQKRFDPGSLELDMMVRNLRGKGRGRGFVDMGTRSILGDNETVKRTKARLLDLVQLLYDRKLLSEEELTERFGLSRKEGRGQDESWENEGDGEASEDVVQALHEEVEVLEDGIKEAIVEIEEELDSVDVTFDEDEDLIHRLRNSVGRLIAESAASKDNALQNGGSS